MGENGNGHMLDYLVFYGGGIDEMDIWSAEIVVQEKDILTALSKVAYFLNNKLNKPHQIFSIEQIDFNDGNYDEVIEDES